MHMKTNRFVGERLLAGRTRPSLCRRTVSTSYCDIPAPAFVHTGRPNLPQLQFCVSLYRHGIARLISSTPPCLSHETASVQGSSSSEDQRTLPKFRDFHQRGILKSDVVKSLPFEYCTDIQAQTLEPIIEGKDVLARGSLGSGRTLAYLVPALDKLLNDPRALTSRKISVLIVTPTRDLALQVASQAELLLKGTTAAVQTAVGGSNLKVQRVRLLVHRCDVLVATSGRLIDHLSETNIAFRLSDVQTLVFDDLDKAIEGVQLEQARHVIRLLDNIRSKTAPPRQTLVFTGNNPTKIVAFVNQYLRAGFTDIVENSAAPVELRTDIEHFYITSKRQDLDAILLLIIRQALRATSTAKVIVFYPYARAASLAYDLISSMPEFIGFPVFRLHGVMKTSQRATNLDGFKDAEQGLMLATDVLRHGLDIRGVSLICHMGIPADLGYYSARLAHLRPGGGSIVVLANEERPLLVTPEMTQINFVPYDGASAIINPDDPALQSATQAVRSAMIEVGDNKRRGAYVAFLAHHVNYTDLLGWTREELVQQANSYWYYCLTNTDSQPPPVAGEVIARMGLDGVDGLRIAPSGTPATRTEPTSEQEARMKAGFKAKFGRAPAPGTLRKGPLVEAAEKAFQQLQHQAKVLERQPKYGPFSWKPQRPAREE